MWLKLSGRASGVCNLAACSVIWRVAYHAERKSKTSASILALPIEEQQKRVRLLDQEGIGSSLIRKAVRHLRTLSSIESPALLWRVSLKLPRMTSWRRNWRVWVVNRRLSKETITLHQSASRAPCLRLASYHSLLRWLTVGCKAGLESGAGPSHLFINQEHLRSQSRAAIEKLGLLPHHRHSCSTKNRQWMRSPQPRTVIRNWRRYSLRTTTQYSLIRKRRTRKRRYKK